MQATIDGQSAVRPYTPVRSETKESGSPTLVVKLAVGQRDKGTSSPLVLRRLSKQLGGSQDLHPGRVGATSHSLLHQVRIGA
eukprot:1673746-Rhodomonas_salina.2